MKTLNEIKDELGNIQLLTELDSKQLGEVQELIEQPGLWHLLSLLLGEKQTKLIMLANVLLTDEAQRARACVLQGEIKALDSTRNTLLELFTTAAERNDDD